MAALPIRPNPSPVVSEPASNLCFPWCERGHLPVRSSVDNAEKSDNAQKSVEAPSALAVKERLAAGGDGAPGATSHRSRPFRLSIVQ